MLKSLSNSPIFIALIIFFSIIILNLTLYSQNMIINSLISILVLIIIIAFVGFIYALINKKIMDPELRKDTAVDFLYIHAIIGAFVIISYTIQQIYLGADYLLINLLLFIGLYVVIVMPIQYLLVYQFLYLGGKIYSKFKLNK